MSLVVLFSSKPNLCKESAISQNLEVCEWESLKNTAILNTMFYKELWVRLLAQCAAWNQIDETPIKFSENFNAIKNYRSGLKKTATDLALHHPLDCWWSTGRKWTKEPVQAWKKVYSYTPTDVLTKNHRKWRIPQRATDNCGQGVCSQVVEPGLRQEGFLTLR